MKPFADVKNAHRYLNRAAPPQYKYHLHFAPNATWSHSNTKELYQLHEWYENARAYWQNLAKVP